MDDVDEASDASIPTGSIGFDSAVELSVLFPLDSTDDGDDHFPFSCDCSCCGGAGRVGDGAALT